MTRFILSTTFAAFVIFVMLITPYVVDAAGNIFSFIEEVVTLRKAPLYYTVTMIVIPGLCFLLIRKRM